LRFLSLSLSLSLPFPLFFQFSNILVFLFFKKYATSHLPGGGGCAGGNGYLLLS